jgi:hypothetical protein
MNLVPYLSGESGGWRARRRGMNLVPYLSGDSVPHRKDAITLSSRDARGLELSPHGCKHHEVVVLTFDKSNGNVFIK